MREDGATAAAVDIRSPFGADAGTAGQCFFARYDSVLVWLAWESFGGLNGTDTCEIEQAVGLPVRLLGTLAPLRFGHSLFRLRY